MIREWACVFCGHADAADSQLHEALQIVAHYEREHVSMADETAAYVGRG